MYVEAIPTRLAGHPIQSMIVVNNHIHQHKKATFVSEQ